MNKKDWAQRVTETRERLEEWVAAYEREYKQRYRKQAGLFRRPSAAAEEQIAKEAQAAAGEAILSELPAFFDELCGFYEESLPGERGKVRAAVGVSRDLSEFLWRYAVEAPDHVRSRRDQRRLELGLLAVSIDDRRVETGLLNDLLGRLWLAGKRVGIDVGHVFQKVALVSNPGAGGGGAFMQTYLLQFPSSPYFKEHVAPKLAA